ncbi:MAG: hypothetical protein JJ974_02615 [Phycisphaerales bacterium]|nr:hypothetical protein [Phycisphaerales bacterium]
MGSIASIVGVILIILASAFVLAAMIFLFSTIFGLTFKVLKGIFSFIGLVFTNIFAFIGATISDSLRLVGAVLAAVLFAPLTVLAILIGRWSRAKHLANAFSMECHAGFRSVYRIFIGNPARLLGLSSALEGVEKRVPEAMAAAPTSDKPNKKRTGTFDGYEIVGSLKSGGSGGKLYIAEPNEIKQAGFTKRGIDVDQVVIKVFSLHDGSSMPQIVRESRALDAARKLGLVLEHELTADRFFYVMRYVPGESLTAVTKRMHSLSPREGLDDTQLKHAIGYADDLLSILDSYHRSGLWHKDVKPDNIIIDGKHGMAKAHLVDFGLVTPLRSAMTLTTHGTEYFRDPELVRQALRGVKVHQIDGSKFDVYAAGAVLYSMIENSFPAHSGLSQISKRCPDALRWIVRRAMAEYDRRYPSSSAMLADLRVVMLADDPFAVKPADLPSVKLGDAVEPTPIPEPMPAYGVAPEARAGSPVPPAPAQPVQVGKRVGRPKVNIVGWWSGKYAVTGEVEAASMVGSAGSPAPAAAVAARRLLPAEQRASAKDQIRHARQRAEARRSRAMNRMGQARKARKTRANSYQNTPGAGMVFAGLLGIAVLFAGVAVVGALFLNESRHSVVYTPDAPEPPSIEEMVLQQSAKDLPMVSADVLFVSGFVSSMDEEMKSQVSAGLAVLNNKGMHTFGDLSEHASEADIIHLADYKNTIGTIPSDSEDLIVRTRSWVNEHEHVDAVMMLAMDPVIDEYQVILVADQFSTRQTLSDHTVGDLLTLMSENGYAAIPD